MRAAWLFTCLFLTVLQVQLVTRRLAREQLNVEAREEIARLVKVTIQLFQHGRPPAGDNSWKELGRTEPMTDPWGRPYVLETSRQGVFVWRSAGPDGGYETADDIASPIPYGGGGGIDLNRPDLAPHHLPVGSAE
jgi:hypothetical protein